jgi:hypothetical protein
MKKISILHFIFFVFFVSCQAQEKKQIPTLKLNFKVVYNGFNFTNFINNFSSNEYSDSTNTIDFELDYHPDSLNKYGKSKGFMIHKKGIKYWFNYAQKKYKEIVFSKNYGYSNAAKMLKGKDRNLLINFDKWMFFIDAKYLTKGINDGERDANDPNLGKPFPDNYVLDETKDYEILLLEQKAGQKTWNEIDRKKINIYKMSEEGQWESAFRKNTLKKYSEMK